MAERYLIFLQTTLQEYLNIPLNILRNYMFQYDGAPAHRIQQYVQFLNDRK